MVRNRPFDSDVHHVREGGTPGLNEPRVVARGDAVTLGEEWQ
jgi:hypothetical protein